MRLWGSCFPKDIKALIKTSRDTGVNPAVLAAVENRNNLQKKVLAEKIKARLDTDLSGRRFALWGLAFKPGTDDMREAASIVLLEDLLSAGATMQACDPVAMNQAIRELPEAWLNSGRLNALIINTRHWKTRMP